MRGAEPIEVVGAGLCDARYHDLREPPVRMAYFPYQQGAVTLERMHFAIRATLDAAALAPEIRALMRELARDVPVVDVNTLTEQIDRTLQRERLLATLSSFFAVLGLVVAAAGLYGLMAFRVTRRRSEIGIRTALGAQRSDILALILHEALLLVSTGAAAGLLLGVARHDSVVEPAVWALAASTLPPSAARWAAWSPWRCSRPICPRRERCG